MSLSRLEAYATQNPDFPRYVKNSLGAAGMSTAEALWDADRAGGLEGITNPEFKAATEQAYELAGRMVGYVGISAPTPENMASRGTDHLYLQGEWEQMKVDGLDPHIILAPHGLGLEGEHGWKKMYAEAIADTTIPNNPLKQQPDGDGLWVNDNAAANWHAFDKAPEITTTPDAVTLPIYETTAPDSTTVQWTLRIIPGTPKPQHLDINYKDTVAQGITHQTVSEMLTDKLTAIMQGKEPSDASVGGLYYYSWCDNGDPTGAHAPGGLWYRGRGQVNVGWFGVGRRRIYLGSRSPLG